MDMKENKGGEKEGEKGPGHETLRGPIHRGSWQHIILYTPLPHRAMTLCSVKQYPKKWVACETGSTSSSKRCEVFWKNMKA